MRSPPRNIPIRLIDELGNVVVDENTPHGFKTGDVVHFFDVEGMRELNTDVDADDVPRSMPFAVALLVCYFVYLDFVFRFVYLISLCTRCLWSMITHSTLATFLASIHTRVADMCAKQKSPWSTIS